MIVKHILGISLVILYILFAINLVKTQKQQQNSFHILHLQYSVPPPIKVTQTDRSIQITTQRKRPQHDAIRIQKMQRQNINTKTTTEMQK